MEIQPSCSSCSAPHVARVFPEVMITSAKCEPFQAQCFFPFNAPPRFLKRGNTEIPLRHIFFRHQLPRLANGSFDDIKFNAVVYTREIAHPLKYGSRRVNRHCDRRIQRRGQCIFCERVTRIALRRYGKALETQPARH